jgi:hypothetical protein
LFALAVAMLFLSLVSGNSVFAESGPCADDVAKFCKDVQPGGGAIAKCLKEHANELSPACKENLVEMKKKINDFSEACKSDLSKFCNKVKPGGGRMLQCLKEHENELSPECKAKMTTAQ